MAWPKRQSHVTVLAKRLVAVNSASPQRRIGLLELKLDGKLKA